MRIHLDHLIVPSRDQRAAAELLARILAVPWSETGVGPFCPVYVNEGLTLDFDQSDGEPPVLHYCFRMSDPEFDALAARLRDVGIGYRSLPHGPVDMQVNSQHGGRIVYWSVPDGHVWEALTLSYARQVTAQPGAAP
jgi:catechol 2,3-dioxygenase-like lactoylglutathione lyase family enzyme